MGETCPGWLVKLTSSTETYTFSISVLISVQLRDRIALCSLPYSVPFLYTLKSFLLWLSIWSYLDPILYCQNTHREKGKVKGGFHLHVEWACLHSQHTPVNIHIWIKTIFQIMHRIYRNISVYMLIGIFWGGQRRTLLVMTSILM